MILQLTGAELRDAGCAAALRAERAAWRVAYYALAEEFLDGAQVGEEFVGEDLRALMRGDPALIEEPRVYNVWGAAFGAVVKCWAMQGLVAKSRREGVPAKSPKNHASSQTVWVVLRKRS